MLVSLLVMALALTGIVSVAAQEAGTPSLTIGDQTLYLTVDTVVSDGPGWVVVHVDDNGSPGEVIGIAAVEDGENNDVQVPLDASRITETVYVMLHEDLGTEGTFEFPGDDAPVQVDGETLMTSLTFDVPEQLPEAGVTDVDDDDDVDPTPTPVGDEDDDDDDVEATPTPVVDDDDDDDDDAEATPVGAADVTPTPDPDATATPDADVTPTPDPDATATPDADVTPTPDPDATATPVVTDEEVLPETGGSVSLLPMLGLAAAGALLLGAGFVFAYRKQD